MADGYGLARQLARTVLRDSGEYEDAVLLGVARHWLSREGDQLAERLMDEAWQWSPRDPAAHPRER